MNSTTGLRGPPVNILPGSLPTTENKNSYVGLIFAMTALSSDEEKDTSSRPQTPIARAIT